MQGAGAVDLEGLQFGNPGRFSQSIFKERGSESITLHLKSLQSSRRGVQAIHQDLTNHSRAGGSTPKLHAARPLWMVQTQDVQKDLVNHVTNFFFFYFALLSTEETKNKTNDSFLDAALLVEKRSNKKQTISKSEEDIL